MRSILIFISLGLLCSCSLFPEGKLPGVFRVDVQQGNVVTRDQIKQLKPGLSQSQVRFLLGTPLVIDTFSQKRWDYIFRLYQADGERIQSRLTIYFDEAGNLLRFNADLEPELEAKTEVAANFRSQRNANNEDENEQDERAENNEANDEEIDDQDEVVEADQPDRAEDDQNDETENKTDADNKKESSWFSRLFTRWFSS